MLEMIAFDADDTLWHNETLYTTTQERFADLLAPYHGAEWIAQRLYETEMRNLEHFGYGIKGFTLSMIETAIELTEGRISGREIQAIMELAREQMRAPVHVLDHVEDVLRQLGESYRLMLLTKGDLFDQETKIARSGLAHYFTHVEIVSDKTPATFRTLLARHGVAAERFLMVGNSLRSDILPALEVGARAAYIPYVVTWAHEVVAHAGTSPNYVELESIAQLPKLVEAL